MSSAWGGLVSLRGQSRTLQPIHSPPCPYHTVTIDFIVGLPEDDGLDALLAATCKFSKQNPPNARQDGIFTTSDWSN